jgi:hypothetical protein
LLPIPICTASVQQGAQAVVRSANFDFLGLIVIVMATVSACTHTPPTPEMAAEKQAPAQAEKEAPRVPNEYLVTLAPDMDESVIPQYYGRFGIKYLHALGGETFLLILADDPGPQAMKVLIQDESRIKVVQPNLIYWDYR